MPLPDFHLSVVRYEPLQRHMPLRVRACEVGDIMGFRKPRTKLTCPICKKTFTLPESEYLRRLSRTDLPLTCSAKCSGLQKCNYRNNRPYRISYSGRGGKNISVPTEAITSDAYMLEIKEGGVLVYTPVKADVRP